MDERLWRAVDAYLANSIIGRDSALEATLAVNAAAGLPQIDVSPVQGKLLYLLARIAGARNALEIGTLGGYSTIWIARALPPEGRLLTLEAVDKHAKVARRNIAHAGMSDRVDVRVGAALESLPNIEAEGRGPFDFVFIDADKANNANYFARSQTTNRRTRARLACAACSTWYGPRPQSNSPCATVTVDLNRSFLAFRIPSNPSGHSWSSPQGNRG